MSYLYQSIFVLLISISAAAASDTRLVWMEGESEESPKPFVVREMNSKAGVSDFHQGIYPSVRSDGSEVTYLAGNTRDQYLLETSFFEKDVHGNQIIEQWFDGPGAYYHPDYSGDGRFLVVSGPFGAEIKAGTRTRSRNQVMLIDLAKARAIPLEVKDGRKIYTKEALDRAGALRMIETEGEAFFPESSSDGSFVVAHLSYVTDKSGDQAHGRGKRKQIFLFNVEKKTYRAITAENEHCMEPAFSADDLYLAFVCRVEGEDHSEAEQIFVYGPLLEGQEKRIHLTKDGVRNLTPTFTANGTIIFSSFRNGQYDLYEQDFRNPDAVAKQLTNSKMIEYAPSTSGDLYYKSTVSTSQLVEKRSSFALAAVGNEAFVFGGHTGGRHEYNENTVSRGIEYWNGTEWKLLDAKLPIAIQGVRAVYHNQVIDLFGGLTHKEGKPTSLDIVQRCYLDGRNQITHCEVLEGVKLSAPRSSYELVVIGNKAFIVGGAETKSMREQIFRANIEVIDISTKDIKVSNFAHEFPKPYRRGFKAVSHDGVGYLVGGVTDDNRFLKDVLVFNPQAPTSEETFKALPNLPLGLFSTSAGIWNNKLYTFGGAGYFGPAKPENMGMVFKYAYYLNHIYELDLNAPEKGWKNTGRYLSEPKAFLEVLPTTDALLIVGGSTSTNEPVTKVETWRAN